MKKYIRSDESDYIKIGNRIIPKNAADFGDASYDRISDIGRRNYEAEVAERKAAEEQARLAELGQEKYDLAFSQLDTTKDTVDQLQQLFEALVPPSGKCDNLAAELVRAMMRVMYRDYNDGDVFYQGYGLETCGSDAAFLMDFSTEDIYQILYDIAADGLEEDTYTMKLEQIADLLISYLEENPQLFAMECKDSREYSSPTLGEIAEIAPKYEFQPDVWDFSPYVDNDCISWRDVYDFLENIAQFKGGEVHQWVSDAYVIQELDKEQYEDWERNYESEVRSWLDELESEFPNYGEEEYDEEEEEL